MIPESRFSQTQVITLNGVTSFGEWRPPSYGNVPERLYVMTQDDLDRPDLIAYRYYGTSEFWWVILDYNKVTDPFSLKVGDRLRIPDWSWGEVIPPAPLVDPQEQALRQPSPSPYIPPPYQVPNRVAAPASLQASVIFNFAIQLPDCDSGLAQIELQLATDPLYADVILSRLTAASIERWFYYDPWANNGQGAHLPFPAQGLNLSAYATQPVYFRITSDDGIVSGSQYYPRFRIILPDVNSGWQGLPPVIIQTD